jgi:hypothetical protein
MAEVPKTLVEAWRLACEQLSVSGPRAVTVKTVTGATICASLYDGEDWARDAKGRDAMHIIHRHYARKS